MFAMLQLNNFHFFTFSESLSKAGQFARLPSLVDEAGRPKQI
jgi:hypothetical protein